MDADLEAAATATSVSPRTIAEVGLRLVIAEALMTVFLMSGFVYTGAPVGMVLSLLVLPAALAWATHHISGFAMFNVVLGVLALSVLGLTSTPGGGDFGGFLVLLGGTGAAALAWIVLLNYRLGDESHRSLLPFLIGPALALVVIVGATSGLPPQARFASSVSDLNALVERPPPPSGAEDREGFVQVTTGVPSSVGFYEVRAVRVNGPGDAPFLQVVVGGDCGWFNECALTYAPDGTKLTTGRMLDDWHANW